MGYESAPATKMLATHCAACARPLVDAASVEVGMGPDCRKKYWVAADVSETARQEANRIVYGIALDQTGNTVIVGIAKLRDLGFVVLAERIAKRVSAIEIIESSGRLLVKTPYNEAVVNEMRAIPGRRWDKDAKLNSFPTTARPALWALLQKHYPGEAALGPKGAFTIPGGKPASACEFCDGSGCRECRPDLAGPPYTADGAVCEDCGLTGHVGCGKHPDLEMAEMEAKADREQTIREERAKHAARARMESGVEKARSRYAIRTLC